MSWQEHTVPFIAAFAGAFCLVILGTPIFDMLRIMATRARNNGSVFSADKSHIHHRLLSLGLSHKEVVLSMYALNIHMGIMALIYRHVDYDYRILFLFNMVLFLFLAFCLIGRGHRKDPER